MFTLDINKKGVDALFKPYEIKALQVLLENDTAFTENLEIWEKVNEYLDEGSISRASIINYMKALKERGYVEAMRTTGKGGKRFGYRLSKDGLGQFLDKLTEELNMATNEAIDKLGHMLEKGASQ